MFYFFRCHKPNADTVAETIETPVKRIKIIIQVPIFQFDLSCQIITIINIDSHVRSEAMKDLGVASFLSIRRVATFTLSDKRYTNDPKKLIVKMMLKPILT